MERAVYRSDAAVVSEVEFDPFRSPHAPSARRELPTPPAVIEGDPPRQSLKAATWRLQVRMLEAALARSKHNQRKAAADLGLTYNQFRGLYRRYQAGQWDPDAAVQAG